MGLLHAVSAVIYFVSAAASVGWCWLVLVGAGCPAQPPPTVLHWIAVTASPRLYSSAETVVGEAFLNADFICFIDFSSEVAKNRLAAILSSSFRK